MTEPNNLETQVNLMSAIAQAIYHVITNKAEIFAPFDALPLDMQLMYTNCAREVLSVVESYLEIMAKTPKIPFGGPADGIPHELRNHVQNEIERFTRTGLYNWRGVANCAIYAIKEWENTKEGQESLMLIKRVVRNARAARQEEG